MNSAELRIPGRLQHVEHLLKVVDALIFIQLAISYYTDNLTLLLILRVACQTLYVQQHKIGSLETPTQLVPVIIANAVCIVTHILHARPEAAIKASHGYIHGGIVLDFIGEKGPISKWRLLAQDLLIFGLQVVMLAIGYEKTVIEKGKKDTATTQDLEAEEAGVRRSQEGATPAPADEPDPPRETEQGIEMQNFSPSADGAHATALDLEDDLLLTLNVRRSLNGLLARNSQRSAEGEESGSTIENAAERLNRLRNLFSRVAASRGAG